MKGLLLKDTYMLINNFRFYILIIIFLVGASLMSKEELFLIAYPPMLLTLLPISLLGYDEKNGWEKYSLTMPYKRSDFVSSKYLLGLILLSVGAALVVISHLIKMYITGTNYITELFIVTLMVICASFLMSVISYPLIFKLGVEKGRLSYTLIIVAFVIAVAFGAMQYTDDLVKNEITPSPTLLVIPAAAAILYVLSWMLSIRIFNKREL